MPPPTVAIDFSFAAGLDGWEASYADYTLGMEPSIAFASGFRQLPSPLQTTSGFLLSSRNVSDDVFMTITRPVTGLVPNTRYRVDISIAFATNAPPGCIGVGGAPGEAVVVKAGATATLPAKVQQGSYVTVNYDKGVQSTGGANAVVIGNIAQAAPGDCNQPAYQRKTLSSGAAGPLVTSDASGRLWLVIGTDSGYEGLTELYYLDGRATLTPA